MKILGTNKNQYPRLWKAFQDTLPHLCQRMVRMWRPCGDQELSESLQWWHQWRAPSCTTLRRRALRSGLGAQYRPSHNAPRMAARWKCPSRTCMQGFICERSRVLLISDQYPEAQGGRRGALSPPEHSEHVKMAPRLSGSPLHFTGCVSRGWYAQQSVSIRRAHTVSPVSCVLASGGSAVLHKTSSYVTKNDDFTYSLWNWLMLTQENSRNWSRNWDLRLLPHFLTLFCSWTTLHAKIRVKI